ncbi:ABC transporter permease [Ancylobacter sp. FA202]|uniref:ABC transporter permease n=1 Tax=Ancylobacter sp. FA202 TaxID=1111106 RepID=UPI00037C7E0F|nr:ABC transporter permease [Ancylobacter sp. FA202]
MRRPAGREPAPARRAGANLDVLPLLISALALVALLLGGFVVVAPNRLLSGTPLSLWQAAGPGGAASLLAILGVIALLAARPALRFQRVLIGLAAGTLMVLALALAGMTASEQAAAAGRLTRVSLGAGFWTLFVAGLLLLADSAERETHRAGKALPLLATLLGLAALIASGRLAQLSLAREYAVRQQAYLDEMLRHLQLTGSGLALALVAGGAIGLLAYRRPRRAGPVFAALNIVQTIPSLALFALLIGPLTVLTGLFPALRSLGIAGIGPFPAILALGLYGLLPVARGVHAGLSAVPNTVVEAALGMGMTRGQIVRHTLIPLALPTLLQTLRLTLVQLIGLAVLAALIGAGGLGTFIFQGLGQTAADLVLLGALSAIALALIADTALRGLTLFLLRRPQN